MRPTLSTSARSTHTARQADRPHKTNVVAGGCVVRPWVSQSSYQANRRFFHVRLSRDPVQTDWHFSQSAIKKVTSFALFPLEPFPLRPARHQLLRPLASSRDNFWARGRGFSFSCNRLFFDHRRHHRKCREIRRYFCSHSGGHRNVAHVNGIADIQLRTHLQ